MFVLLAGLALGACSSSDDDTNINGNGGNGTNAGGYTETVVTEPPLWQVDWTSNQARPDWTEPDFASIYENWTSLKVQIEDFLIPHASSDDLLAIFVNGEMRGVTGPAVVVGSNETIPGRFMMKVWGNEKGTEKVHMSLQYYSSKLKNLFILSDDIVLNPDMTIGIDSEFIPKFSYGTEKYPYVMGLSASNIIAKAGITPASGDYFAAFVGEECRGIGYAVSGMLLTVYGRAEGESVTLKYYETATEKIYTFPDVAKTK